MMQERERQTDKQTNFWSFVLNRQEVVGSSQAEELAFAVDEDIVAGGKEVYTY